VRLLVVSAPRSGTLYAAAFFTALGIPTLHENAFNLHGDHDWETPYGESSWLAAPYLNEAPADLLILHQWRNLKLSAASLERHEFFHVPESGYTTFARQHVHISPAPNQALKFQRKWHALIHERLIGRTHISYWVEDLDVALGTRICHYLGHEPSLWQRARAAEIPRNLHTNLFESTKKDPPPEKARGV